MTYKNRNQFGGLLQIMYLLQVLAIESSMFQFVYFTELNVIFGLCYCLIQNFGSSIFISQSISSILVA